MALRICLSAELIAGLTEFESAVPINDFLSRLLLLQAQERIPPRRAAVMAYTCNLLLRTLPAINLEQKDKDKGQGRRRQRCHPPFPPPHLQEIILQKRRFAAEVYAKSRSAQAKSPEEAGRAFYARLSGHSGSDDTNAPNTAETPSSANTKEST